MRRQRARVDASARAALVAALHRPRYEVIPVPGVEDAIVDQVPRDITVTVTASPRQGAEATLRLTERLALAGYRAVPHLAARDVIDESQLGEALRRLHEAGVGDAFVIGGDARQPAGSFSDAFSLLEAMAGLGPAPQRVGIAGYPEGHPFIGTDTLRRAMAAKAPLATYVITQMCFDVQAVEHWAEQHRHEETGLPVHVGIAGAVDPRRLLRIATRIGVGRSARLLRQHRDPVLRLLRPGGYRPDDMVQTLSSSLAEPETPLVGLHIYTLNDLAATERWRRQTLDRVQAAA